MIALIDESGYPRLTDSTRRPVLISVCVKEEDIKEITQDIKDVKKRLYGHTNEIKSTRIFRPATIVNNHTINQEYGESIVSIIARYDITIFAIVMEHPTANIYTPENFLPKQYHLLFKKIETYCANNGVSKMVMVFDSVSNKEDKALYSLTETFLLETPFGNTFRHILEMPLFVNSAITSIIELPDMCAGLIRNYYERCDGKEPSSPYEVWIQELFSKVQAKTVNLWNKATGHREYGFQHVSNLSYSNSDMIVKEEEVSYNTEFIVFDN